MSEEKEVEEIKHRDAFADELGRAEGIVRQRKRGKLTIRERIDALVDEGSFRQMGKLAGNASYDDHNELTGFVPSASGSGMCRINDGEQAVHQAQPNLTSMPSSFRAST